MASYKAEGVVLRTYDLGEADKILVLYTKTEGKLSCVAKGARKPKGRFAPAAQVFGHNEYLLHRGRSLDVVSQYQSLRSHKHIRDDLDRYAYASLAVEMVNETTQDRDGSPEVYELLLWILDIIDCGRNIETAIVVFQMRLMEILGYRPELSRCALCGEHISCGHGFSSAAGGVVCEACAPDAAGTATAGFGLTRTLSSGALASLRLLQQPGDRWQVLRLSGEVGDTVASVIEDYIYYRIEKRLKSLEFLKSLRQGK